MSDQGKDTAYVGVPQDGFGTLDINDLRLDDYSDHGDDDFDIVAWAESWVGVEDVEDLENLIVCIEERWKIDQKDPEVLEACDELLSRDDLPGLWRAQINIFLVLSEDDEDSQAQLRYIETAQRCLQQVEAVMRANGLQDERVLRLKDGADAMHAIVVEDMLDQHKQKIAAGAAFFKKAADEAASTTVPKEYGETQTAAQSGAPAVPPLVAVSPTSDAQHQVSNEKTTTAESGPGSPVLMTRRQEKELAEKEERVARSRSLRKMPSKARMQAANDTFQGVRKKKTKKDLRDAFKAQGDVGGDEVEG